MFCSKNAFSRGAITLVTTASFFIGMGMALAEAETYSATVNDGTPVVLDAKTSLESESLPEVAPPSARRTKSKLAKPQPRVAVIEEPQKMQTAQSVDPLDALDAAPQAAGVIDSGGYAHAPRAVEAPKACVPPQVVSAPPVTIAAPPVTVVGPATAINTASDPLDGRMAEKRDATVAFKKAQAEKLKNDLRRAYYPVPEKNIPQLALRLKYANEILKRWGRAYDYRQVTLAEFRQIHARLEKSDENKSQQN